MEKNLFLDVARSITNKSERKRLLDFIRSPYLNLSEKAALQVQLMEMAWQWWDGGQEEYWEEQKVFALLFGEQEVFSQGKLDKFKSKVLTLVEQFFTEEARHKRQHPAASLRWQMQYYRDKEDFHAYGLAEKAAREELAARKNLVSVDEYLEMFLLEDEVAWLYPGENHSREEHYLSKAVEMLDQFWFAARARWSCVLLNQQQRNSSERDVHEGTFMQMLKTFEGYGPAENILTKAYEQAARLFEEAPDHPVELLEGFLDFMENNCAGLAPLIRDELAGMAANFCVRQANAGRYEFIPKHFDIFQKRLESGSIYRNGKILASDFHSIVNTALRLPREKVPLDWIKQFLDTHRRKLYNREAAEEMVRYNYANYYFHVADFENARKNLKETYRDLNFKIVSKILEIKTLYELKEPRVDERLESAQSFFRREPKIPENKSELLMRFVSYVRRLRDPGLINHPARLEKITRELDDTIVAERPWLQAKVQELGRGRRSG